MIDTPEARFAIQVTREAALLARQVQREMVTNALTKGDKSPVTVGDFASQAVVAKRLVDHFPEATLIGEENSDSLRNPSGVETLAQVTHFVQSILPDATPEAICDWIDLGANEPGDVYWTLDPIDGTKGFLRGDQYAVALALVSKGQVILGALGCPELECASTPAKGGQGSLLIAARGKGTHVCALEANDEYWRQLKVSSTDNPTQTRLLRSVEKAHTNLGAIDYFAQAMGISANPIGMDSQAKYAVLAAGGGEMLVRLLSPDRPDYREKVWDQAAGSIVVEEAGGQVSDLDGKRLDFGQGRTLAQNRGVLATNGALHASALAALREIGA